MSIIFKLNKLRNYRLSKNKKKKEKKRKRNRKGGERRERLGHSRA